MYSQETLQQYATSPQGPPHIWELTSTCFQKLFKDAPAAPAPSVNQAVLITGESGAGKTFNTRKVCSHVWPPTTLDMSRCQVLDCNLLQLRDHRR